MRRSFTIEMWLLGLRGGFPQTTRYRVNLAIAVAALVNLIRLVVF